MTTWFNKEKLKSIGVILIPYLIIIAIALLSVYTLFFIGVPSGDDKEFHLSQIQDLYLGFTRGQFRLTTNHTFLGIFALDNFGYYGPFPHYAAASFQFLFSWAGVDTIGAYKTIICLSVIFSGIFAYWLAMEISHQNRKLSTIATAIYIAMPYQAFCGLCRQAYAETVAITFNNIDVFLSLASILKTST